jgi:hypothetical protein
MKSRKPDIFLGITMCMLVLAAVLCIVILFVQKNNESKETTEATQITTEAPKPSGNETLPPITTEEIPTTEKPQTPVELAPINDAGLKAELDESLRGLTSEWQVMVIDPALGTKVGSAVNCGVDNWMTANRMAQVFIMGAVFQQAKDGTLVLEDVIEDVKSMITNNDTYAADRLTERLGAGDSSKGREAVKSFAVSYGLKLGFNRSLSGTGGSQKNYVTAQQTAELLGMICSGLLVSEDASQQMLDILLTPAEELEIDAGLADDVQYGFVTDIESGTCICAMGVVRMPNRSFVISIVCNKPVTTEGAKKKLTELITLVAPYFKE